MRASTLLAQYSIQYTIQPPYHGEGAGGVCNVWSCETDSYKATATGGLLAHKPGQSRAIEAPTAKFAKGAEIFYALLSTSSLGVPFERSLWPLRQKLYFFLPLLNFFLGGRGDAKCIWPGEREF